METTTSFTTANANSYLYDSQNQHIITIHPVIQFIAEKCNKSLLDEGEIKKFIQSKFTELNDSDISL